MCQELTTQLFTHLESPKKYTSKKIEKWIFNSPELENILKNDYYYELIGLDFKDLKFPTFKMLMLENLSDDVLNKWKSLQEEQISELLNNQPKILVLRIHKPGNSFDGPDYANFYDEYIIENIINFNYFKKTKVNKYTNYPKNQDHPTVSGILLEASYKSKTKNEKILFSENLIEENQSSVEVIGKQKALVFTIKLKETETFSFYSDVTYFSKQDWGKN